MTFWVEDRGTFKNSIIVYIERPEMLHFFLQNVIKIKTSPFRLSHVASQMPFFSNAKALLIPRNSIFENRIWKKKI